MAQALIFVGIFEKKKLRNTRELIIFKIGRGIWIWKFEWTRYRYNERVENEFWHLTSSDNMDYS